MSTIIFFGQFPAAEDPDDPDDDYSFSSFTDQDGAKMRAGRATVLVAADSCLNSALESPERCAPDFHEIRSARTGRGSPTGGSHRVVVLDGGRAGETHASREWSMRFSEAGDRRPRTADTSFRTDMDAAKLAPATWKGFMVADSDRNADLLPMPGTDQDAHHVAFAGNPEDAVGFTHRIVAHQSGRAGEASCALAWLVRFSEAGEPMPRGTV